MKLVNFNKLKPTLSDIDEYYQSALSAIESYYDDKLNLNYKRLFDKMSQSEVDEKHIQSLNELSMEAGLMLLAFIESEFRTDFVKRIENRKGKLVGLNKYFRDDYNPACPIYQYSLSSIFHGWKNYYGNCSKAMTDILNTLPQYYDYRNWIAHGRYWVYKESNYQSKYKYQALQMMAYNVLSEFNGKFLK